MRQHLFFFLHGILIVFVVTSCTNHKISDREIKVGGYRIVGEITDDSIYNGNVRFYKISSNKLAEETQYDKGVMNGKRSLFYENGTVLSTSYYEKGKLIGDNLFFDSSGQISNKTFWYYDLRVGPSIDYLNSDPIRYSFYTFENELIYSLDYANLRDKKIVDINDNFFRLVGYDSTDYWQGQQRNVGVEYKIYLLNPPKFNFDYDIVEVDSSYQVIKVIDKLNSNLPFAFFTISASTSAKYMNAVRLKVVDSLNSKNNYLMYKKLIEY